MPPGMVEAQVTAEYRNRHEVKNKVRKGRDTYTECVRGEKQYNLNMCQ